MFNYNIIQSPSFTVNPKTIDLILKSFSNILKETQKGTLNIVFLDPYSIQNLNKNYRKIDKTTDVLSFHYFDDFSKLNDDEIAGEIILNEEKIIYQGTEYGLGKEKEFYKLVIHSILHILGYDHEEDNDYKIMSELEKTIWQEVFEK